MKPVLVEASIAVAVKLGVWSVLVYEPVRVVVEGLDRIFIDEPIAVVVEFVGGVFVDLAVAVVVELLVRPVLVEESVVVVVDEFGRVFIDASVTISTAQPRPQVRRPLTGASCQGWVRSPMRQLLISAADCRGQSRMRRVARREGMGVRGGVCVMELMVGLYHNWEVGTNPAPQWDARPSAHHCLPRIPAPQPTYRGCASINTISTLRFL